MHMLKEMKTMANIFSRRQGDRDPIPCDKLVQPRVFHDAVGEAGFCVISFFSASSLGAVKGLCWLSLHAIYMYSSWGARPNTTRGMV